jgi:hypothetical protein
MAEVAYYSHENLDTGEYEGLLRLSMPDGRLEYATPAGWVANTDEASLKRLFFPGADAPDLIPVKQARELAARIGVALAQ